MRKRLKNVFKAGFHMSSVWTFSINLIIVSCMRLSLMSNFTWHELDVWHEIFS